MMVIMINDDDDGGGGVDINQVNDSDCDDNDDYGASAAPPFFSISIPRIYCKSLL